VNNDGHDTIRIPRHKLHGCFVRRNGLCIGDQIEPDFGIRTDFCGVAVSFLPWNWKLLLPGHHVMVVVRSRRGSKSLNARTRVKVRAERVTLDGRINPRQVEIERGALLPSTAILIVALAASRGLGARGSVRRFSECS
jgi:hypothetical protein